jgi:hypothetical protein
MSKYGTVGGALFQPLTITNAGVTPLSLHLAKARSPRLLLPFTRWCKTDDVGAWFKIQMQVWMLQYLICDFKESDGAIIDAHDPEAFKTRTNEDWESDSKHVASVRYCWLSHHLQALP